MRLILLFITLLWLALTEKDTVDSDNSAIKFCVFHMRKFLKGHGCPTFKPQKV